MNDDDNKWRNRFISLVYILLLVGGCWVVKDESPYADTANEMRVYGY